MHRTAHMQTTKIVDPLFSIFRATKNSSEIVQQTKD